MRVPAKYLLGYLVPQRALISESSDPTIIRCIPRQGGPVLPGVAQG